MDTTVRQVALDGAVVAVTIGFWVPPTSTFSWISCGELGPIVVDAHGDGDLLEGPRLPPLGAGGRGEIVRTRQLTDGDRLILASDGVLDRTSTAAEAFGIQGSSTRCATRSSAPPPAPSARSRPRSGA